MDKDSEKELEHSDQSLMNYQCLSWKSCGEAAMWDGHVVIQMSHLNCIFSKRMNTGRDPKHCIHEHIVSHLGKCIFFQVIPVREATAVRSLLTAPKNTSHLLQLEKSPHRHEDPTQPN